MSTTESLTIKVGADSISLFGQDFYKRGESWVVPIGKISMEVTPGVDNLAGIEQCITNDRSEEKEEMIDHVRMSNREVAYAYLEGKISKSVFESAEENEEYVKVQMVLAGKEYAVRIYPESAEMPSGTYTATGEIV